MNNIIDLQKLGTNLKKLFTRYWIFTNHRGYKIEWDNLIVYGRWDYNYKEIQIEWVDNISYEIAKNRLQTYFYRSLFDTSKDKKREQAIRNLEKYKKIRNFRTAFDLR